MKIVNIQICNCNKTISRMYNGIIQSTHPLGCRMVMTLLSCHFVVLIHTTQAWNHLPLCLRSQQIQSIIFHIQRNAQEDLSRSEACNRGCGIWFTTAVTTFASVCNRQWHTDFWSIHHQQYHFHVHHCHWIKPAFLATHLQAYLLLTIFSLLGQQRYWHCWVNQQFAHQSW